MKIVNYDNGNENEHVILAVDDNNNTLGHGFVVEFEDSDLHASKRMNYYMDVEVKADDKNYEIRDFIVNELIAIAEELRKRYPDYDARVYNCCFSDNTDKIEYYKRFNGFNADEGMYVLTHDLREINSHKPIDNLYEVKEDSLDTEEDINCFINAHKKVFVSSPYSLEKIVELKKQEGFKNIAIYYNNNIVACVLLIIENEYNVRYGLVEDLFVSKEHRGRGLGEYLVICGLNYFKQLGLSESRLEVWSANERAPKLYYKSGYRFLKQTEVSTGKSI